MRTFGPHAQYLQSPGTKAYTVAEARELFADFRRVEIETVLTHDDLLTSQAGQRHTGPLLDLARRILAALADSSSRTRCGSVHADHGAQIVSRRAAEWRPLRVGHATNQLEVPLCHIPT